jgi:hypothetical protein
MYKRQIIRIALGIMLAVSLLVASAGLAFADYCGENRAGPSILSYTFERGTGWGRVPGHLVIGFPNPLPNGWRIEGGDARYWKDSDDGRWALFLGDSLPWKYEMVWNVNCVDPWPVYAPSPYG